MNMISKSVCLLLLFVFALTGCEKADEKISADKLSVTWTMGENNYQGKGGFISSFTIVNNSKADLSATGWNIYFNFPRVIKPETVTGGASIKHINGDFYALSPTEKFSLPAGDSVTIDFISGDWAINNSDAPAGLYLV